MPDRMPVTVSTDSPVDTLTPEERVHRLAQVHGALQFAHDNLWDTLPEQVQGELQGEIMDTIVLLNQARKDYPNGKP